MKDKNNYTPREVRSFIDEHERILSANRMEI